METYKLKTDDGLQFGFAIENFYISSYKIAKVLSEVNGINGVKKRKLFERRPDNEYRLEFEYLGESFLIVEPFGDNSQYWIIPKDRDRLSKKIGDIEEVFRHYRPPILIKLLGDLISLKPLSFALLKLKKRF